MLTENQKKRFETESELDFSFGIQNLGALPRQLLQAARLRVGGHPADSVQCASTFEELGLPEVVAQLAERPRGLVPRHRPDRLGRRAPRWRR